jgi:PQQ-dependent catabolism-associated beta-propeller protein
MKYSFILFFMFIYNFEAFAIQKIIVSNERGNSLSILSPEGKVIKEIKTCGRPRGLHFYQKQTKFLVACADDDLILIYNTNSLEVINRITNVASPETFDLNPDGETLMISNEEDSTASEWNLLTGEFINEYETGEEPEGVLITKDGKLAFVASEVADVVHVINLDKKIIQKDIAVDRRPRRFAMTVDEKLLYVSAELSSVINVINISSLKVINTIKFLPNGFRKEQVTPVDLILSKNSEIGYVALGRANHVGLFNYRTNKVLDYILVGKRAWGLALSKDEKLLYVANGLSDDISIIDTKKQKVIKSVKVGSVPYGILIVE